MSSRKDELAESNRNAHVIPWVANSQHESFQISVVLDVYI